MFSGGKIQKEDFYMANNIEKQLKEISERLEQGVKEIFTSERYT